MLLRQLRPQRRRARQRLGLQHVLLGQLGPEVRCRQQAVRLLQRHPHRVPAAQAPDREPPGQLGIRRLHSVRCFLFIIIHTPLLHTNYESRDDIADRTFPWMSNNIENATISECIAGCSRFGYEAGGLEYGYQCCKSAMASRFIW